MRVIERFQQHEENILVLELLVLFAINYSSNRYGLSRHRPEK
jgi:hypothetical protein